MLRIHGTERPTKHQGMTVLDIFHVWPDGHVENGVKHRSWVFVYLQGQQPEGAADAARVTLYLPGQQAREVQLHWGEELYADVPAWGIASVTVEGDIPVEFFWELVPGKE